MREYIKQWVKSKRPKSFIGHKVVKSMVSWESYDFMGPDDRIYSLSVVYDKTRIIGSPESMVSLMLTDGNEQKKYEESVEDILDSLLVSCDSVESWQKNRRKEVTKEALDNMVRRYLERAVVGVSSVSTSNFTVVSAELITPELPMLALSFLFDNVLQLPVRIIVGEPSLVKRRDYGVYTQEFFEFMGEVGSVSGGIVWY
jgi:hypothetical protein